MTSEFNQTVVAVKAITPANHGFKGEPERKYEVTVFMTKYAKVRVKNRTNPVLQAMHVDDSVYEVTVRSTENARGIEKGNILKWNGSRLKVLLTPERIDIGRTRYLKITAALQS